jgi:hypothetical protein
MDEWRKIGTLEAVAGGALTDEPTPEDGYDDGSRGTTFAHIVKVKRDNKRVTDKDVRQALRDTFTYSYCTHEHDCCGCRSYHAYDVHKQSYVDAWVVIQTSSRNL